MKNMKKLIAALLVLSIALALTGTAFAKAKFTKNQAAEGLFVKFNSNVYGYNDHRNSSKSKIIVRKNSVGLLVDTYGSKWAQVVVTDGAMNAMGKEKVLWFGVDSLEALEDQESGFISCTFGAGGSGLSEQEGVVKFKALKGKKITLTGKANLRKTGSLKGKSQGVVRKDQKLTCTGKVAYDSRLVVFFQVKYNGNKYYVSSEYVKNWANVIIDAAAEEGI